MHVIHKEERERPMDNKPVQNIQDSFLNTARKERMPITIYLLSGVKLTGRIRSFDKYSVVLETNNQEQLIFKHAISTVVMTRSGGHHTDTRPQPAVEDETGATKSEG
jgi:host factor-I protein